MSAADILLRHEMQALKAATRKAVAAAGGGEGSGFTLSRRQQYMSECGNVHHGRYLQIHDVAALERVTNGDDSHPAITRMLCRLAGGVFVPLPDIGPMGADLMASTVSLASEMGDVSQMVISRFTDDGVIDKGDLSAIEREIDELQEAAERLRNHARALEQRHSGAGKRGAGKRNKGER